MERSNYSEILKKAETQDGKRLLSYFQQCKGSSMEDAVSAAKTGDYTKLQELISQIMQNPEVKELVDRMRDAHE